MDRPTPEDLGRWLRDELVDALGSRYPGLEVSFRSRATSVADGTTVLLLRDAARRPRAVALCSSPAAPDMVLRNTSRARLAKQALGTTLGSAILDALVEGRVRGLSYAVMPFCVGLSDSRPVWALQRTLLRGPVLDWLWRATERTAADVEPAAMEAAFAVPLRHLVSLVALSGRVRVAAERATVRLGSGTWVPRRVLMHGDLWKGNILIRPNSDAAPAERWRDRFAIIDWPGSAVRGYGIFDLLRLALSFRLRPQRLRAEVLRHCRILRCAPEDGASHLLAALGHLSLNLEHFPPHLFARTAEACYAALAGASE